MRGGCSFCDCAALQSADLSAKRKGGVVTDADYRRSSSRAKKDGKYEFAPAIVSPQKKGAAGAESQAESAATPNKKKTKKRAAAKAAVEAMARPTSANSQHRDPEDRVIRAIPLDMAKHKHTYTFCSAEMALLFVACDRNRFCQSYEYVARAHVAASNT